MYSDCILRNKQFSVSYTIYSKNTVYIQANGCSDVVNAVLDSGA